MTGERGRWDQPERQVVAGHQVHHLEPQRWLRGHDYNVGEGLITVGEIPGVEVELAADGLPIAASLWLAQQQVAFEALVERQHEIPAKTSTLSDRNEVIVH